MTTVELRPMSLGELLDRVFSVYKSHFWLFVSIMAAPYLVVLAVNVLGSVWGPLASHPAGGSHPASAGTVVASMLGLVFSAMVFIAMFAVAQGATVFAVSDVYLGRPASARQAYSRVRGKVGRIILLVFMISLAIAGGFILLIIPGIIALCRTAVAVPVAMLEDVKARKAFNRSVSLTKGHALSIFVVFVFLFILSWVSLLIFQFPFVLAMGLFTKPHALPLGLAILNHLSTFLGGVLVGPIGTIAYALFYYDLRVRKEAFDLQVLMASLDSSGVPRASSPA